MLTLISCAHNERKVITVPQITAKISEPYFSTPASIDDELSLELKKYVKIKNSYTVSKKFGSTVRVGIIDHTYLDPDKFKNISIKNIYVKTSIANTRANFFNNHAEVVLKSLLEEISGLRVQVYNCVIDATIDIHECLSWFKQENIEAINMSIGIFAISEKTQIILQSMMKEGVVVTAASGNRSMVARDICAMFEKIICVGALDNQNKPESYSDFGPYVSAWERGLVMYRNQVNNGTSFAAPRHLGKIIKYNSFHRISFK